MGNLFVVIAITAGVVAFFAVGMSLTLMIKGHNIKSEIGDNDHMRSRGIKCAIQEAREQEGLAGEDCTQMAGCQEGSCSTCALPGHE